MAVNELSVLENSARVAHEWINELSDRLDWTSKRSALRLLRSTLHRVRDHLMPDELAQMSAQLPLLIRGMFFEGWVPKRTPIRERGVADFINAIEDGLGDAQEYRGPEDIKCVFDLLNAHVSAGEIEDVRANLPGSIRALWPAP